MTAAEIQDTKKSFSLFVGRLPPLRLYRESTIAPQMASIKNKLRPTFIGVGGVSISI